MGEISEFLCGGFKATTGVHEIHLHKPFTLYHLSKVVTNLCDVICSTRRESVVVTLKGPATYICIYILWWNCSNEAVFLSLVKMSLMDPPWWP